MLPAITPLMLVAIIITLFLQISHAYELGDPVSLVVRTSSRGITSGWSDMRQGSLPRFGVDTMADIIPEFQQETLATDTAFKLKFALSERRFLLPWTEIADGAGTFAQSVVFDIQYMGNDVRSVHAHIETSDMPSTTPPSRIHLKYIWEEIPSTDEEMGLRILFVTSFILGLIGTITSICL
jgi:hypothetical protein